MADTIPVDFCHHRGLLLHGKGQGVIHILLSDGISSFRQFQKLLKILTAWSQAGFGPKISNCPSLEIKVTPRVFSLFLHARQTGRTHFSHVLQAIPFFLHKYYSSTSAFLSAGSWGICTGTSSCLFHDSQRSLLQCKHPSVFLF